MVVWRMLFVGGGEVKLASVSEIGLSFFYGMLVFHGEKVQILQTTSRPR